MEGVPFGRYLLDELLGRGGMGEVWRAYDTETHRVVAIKLLHATLAHDPTFEQRFRREARTAAGLNDPHIIPIHHFGEIDGRLYVDMRFVDGHDLLVEISSGAVDPVRAVTIIQHSAIALDTAHRAGLVHRDVKPSNILIDHSDFCYLIDFGIARHSADTALTHTGAMLGTWAYMAPERFSTGQIDARSDVYSLACVLFECLTGSQPYPGSTFERVAAGHLFDSVPQPSATSAGLAMFDSVISMGMAKLPEDRFATAGDLAAAARAAARPSAAIGTVVASAQPPSADATMSAELFAGAATQLRASIPSLSSRPAAWNKAVMPLWRPRRNVARAWGAMLGAISLVLVSVAVVVAASDGDAGEPTRTPDAVTTARPTTSPIPNTGPFTGNYRAQFAFGTNLHDERRDDGQKPSAEVWDIRSACGADGCVAVGYRRNSGMSSEVMTFDDIGGQWVAVNSTTGTCLGLSNEVFEVFVLQPRPDGTLVGSLYLQSSNGCSDKYPVTFTRITDLYTDDMPDPTEFPPRVVPPAVSLWGRYHYTIAYANGYVGSDDFAVTTYCQRTAMRCVSFFHNEASSVALVFANGKWTDVEEYEGTCSKGGVSQIKRQAEFPLPQSPSDPITLLVGHGVEATSGSACTGGGYQVTFERTGD
jgi:Protein kinase domain